MSLARARPAERIDERGASHVDVRTILRMAAPLMANSAIQSLLNLTDTWFVGRLSGVALAALASIYWVVLCSIMLLGGVGMAVQTRVAQAVGSRRRARASHAAWSGLYASLLTVPAFVLIGFAGRPLLELLHLPHEMIELALAYWWPRLAIGGPLGLLVWSLTGFFNGIGRTGVTLVVTAVMAITNVPFNQWCMFDLHLGIAGSAWGTIAAEVVGLGCALAVFLGPRLHAEYRSRFTWRRPAILAQFRLGLPMGLGITADLAGLALFQLMLVSESSLAGAVTQIVMMLTSLAYLPGIGIALAGTTLVGQAVGAGDVAWARRVGEVTIRITVVFMGLIGLLIGFGSSSILPLFTRADDPTAPAMVALGVRIAWLAAAYQAFDGLNLGSSFCLRGAADARVPALIVALLSWVIYVPLVHMVTFAPGHGWVAGLPQWGQGAIGGWAVSVGYVVALGTLLYLRWRSRAWEAHARVV
jgi:MATE family multidrug resistance protein